MSDSKKSNTNCSSDQLGCILDNLDGAVFALSTDKSLTYCNVLFSEFIQTQFGISVIIGMMPDEYILNKYQKAWDSCLKQAFKGHSGNYELQITSPDGHDTWFEISTNPIYRENKLDGVAGFIKNVEVRKMDEDYLRKALEKEIELNQIKSRFIRVAAHQFKTPLTTIKSNVELIYATALRVDRNDPKFEDNLSLYKKRINKEIDKIVFQMDDVLHTERSSTNTEIETNLENNDLVELCDDLVSNFNTLRPGGRILEYKLSGTPVRLPFNTELMQHALFNLLDNAFKYSSDNPRLVVKFGKSEAKIIIEDDGIGIPKEEINNLFTPFFRASNTKKFEGNGLGLNIAHQYLKKNNAEIKVDSTLNKGTRFTITIPTR